MEDEWRKEDKLLWFAENSLVNIPFVHIEPDKNNSWVNISENDFATLIPICDRAVKSGKSKKAIFKEFTIGSNTARDEWVYSINKNNLKNKLRYFVKSYNEKITQKGDPTIETDIKWTRGLKQRFEKKIPLKLDESKIISAFYRPYNMRYLYHSADLNEMPSLLPKLLVNENLFITFSGSSHSKPFQALAVNNVFSFDFLEKTTGVPFYTFDNAGQRQENITDWGLNQFIKQYKSKKIKKEDIFNYCYAALFNPVYRNKYALNLKRDFPRLPYYEDFYQWADWGKQLIDLHLNFDSVDPFALTEEITDNKDHPRPKLKSIKDLGIIVIDENTQITGILALAWEYKLGNRSALDWLLDQYKESKSKDATIADHFNTYRLKDYKVQLLDLIKKVCTVSIKTMGIIEFMKAST